MNNYRETIKQIQDHQFKKILVTGPQRSGTTITAKIVANELKFDFIDEREIEWDNFDLLFNLYQKTNFVLQSPGLCAYSHMMPGAVILVRRSIEDIVKSQERIEWAYEKYELKKYFLSNGIIAKIKYKIWDKWQKNKSNMFEIDYESITDHPWYVKHRSHFKPKQTSQSLGKLL